MSGDLTRFTGGLSRLPRDSRLELSQIEQGALVKATKVAAIGFVTQAAMMQVASLSNLEGQLIKQVPLAEARLKAIGDTATGAIAAEIARLGF